MPRVFRVTSERNSVPRNLILRYRSSVLSSSLTRASPLGHCERVVTASHAGGRPASRSSFRSDHLDRSRWSLMRTNSYLFGPSTEPPSHSREILLRPLSPSAVFESHGRQDHAPRLRLPATTEAPALVPELHLLVHVVGRSYPSDRSGVFRSPDLSQFPKGTALDLGSS